MKNYKFLSKKTIIGGSVIFIAFLFILMAFSPALAGTGQQIETAQQASNYMPAPTMNTNITWSVFHYGWKTLEYNNGTANTTLNAGVSNYYANPISVNPTDIQANGTLQNEKIGTSSFIWENTSGYINYSTTNDSSYAKITSGKGTLAISGNTSPEASTCAAYGAFINVANFPSNNLQYDYVTFIYGLSGASMTGVYANINLWNSTNYGSQFGSIIHPGQVGYITENLAQFQKQNGYTTTFNTSGAGKTNSMEIEPQLDMPKSSTTQDYTLTIYGMAFTSYAMDLGTNNTGTVAKSLGNAQLSSFAPSFPYTEVINNGYSVAVSQSLQNETETQSSINDGQYIEAATVQGNFELPTAPDLSYKGSNVSMPIVVNTSQFEVLNLNDASYLNSLPARDNGTFGFGSVNPNSPNNMIIEQKFTAAQWNSITKAPSFFTLRGIEYYWWVAIIGILSVVGLGAAAASHFGGDEETLKIPKGKFGR